MLRQSNGYELDRFRFRKEICKNWFTNRVVGDLNILSRCVPDADTDESLK